MYDDARAFAPKSAARYSLRQTSAGFRVTLLLDERWLRDGTRKFPVTADPTVTATGPTQTTDASLLESVPDSGYGGSEGIFIGEYAAWPGYDNRGVLKFDLSEVPADAKVLQAKLGLKSYYTESSTAKKVGLHALTHDFTTDATWNNYDATNAWSSAGGDFESEPAAVSTVGAAPGWEYWYPTELVQGWVEGSRENHGLLLADMPGEPSNGTEFRSSEYGTAADRPHVDVMWYPRTGDLPTYTYDEHRLPDGTVVKVNLQNGNVVYARPATLGTGPGEDFVMGHYFNSVLEGTGSVGGFGASPWVAANGKWVGATVMDNGDFIHQGLTGYVLPFIKQSDGSFRSPPELDATLVEDTGAGWNERYELTFSDTSKMTFSADGTWTSHTDADENTYTLNYPSPSYQHASVTGTDDEDTTFTYTTGSQSQELLHTVTDPDDNEFTYGYTSDRLTSETYESSTLATYAYDGNGRLSSITDGDSNTIGLRFDTAGRLETFTDGSNETRYTYDEPDDSCEGSATALTTVLRPDGAAVSTCFDAQGFELPPLVDTEGELSGDLVVTPTDDPQSGPFTSGGTAWVIARMPATKTIDQVTLGDFGKVDGCSTATTATLGIEKLQGGEYGYYQQFASSSGATIPTDPDTVTWTLSQNVTLEKGESYHFTVQKDGGGCDLQRTTWAQASIIDGGPRPCNSGPETAVNSTFGQRIWHQQGTTETNCYVFNMDPSLPSGWYSTHYYGFGSDKSIAAGNARVPPFAPTWSNGACDDRYGTSNGLQYGLVPEIFITDPNDPTWQTAACRFDNYAPYGVKPANGWHYAPAWQPGPPTHPRAMYAKLRSVSYSAVLEKYAPQLVLDSQEDYHPDAWETATDALPSEMRDRRQLYELASHGSGPQLAPSWLVPLKSPYPGQGNGTAERSHYLDLGSMRGQDMPTVAAAVRSSGSGYTDKTYARAVRGSDDKLYIQYWFWYFYNEAAATGPLNHEGDWEFVQLRLDANLDADEATYSQHTHTETCSWEDVPLTNDGRPKVWPSRNRHANYFQGGQHNPLFGAFYGVSSDQNDSSGDTVDPDVIEVDDGKSFLRWPGSWGASLVKNSLFGALEADSPRGPQYQDTWDPTVAREKSNDVACTTE